MNPDQPFNIAPRQGAPASPFDERGSSVGGAAHSSHSLGYAAGGNSSANRFADNQDAAALSQHSSVSMSVQSGAGAARPFAAAANPAAAVKVPWDDDDDDLNTPSALATAQEAAPASPPASEGKPAPSFLPEPAPAAVPPQDNMSPFSAFPPEPRATPQSPPQHGDVDDFIAPSPLRETLQGSPDHLPTSPEKPSTVNKAKMDALNKQIASRTAAYDAATKEKENKILAAAQEFIKALKAKREKEVLDARANHKKVQQVDANKIDAYKKSGAVWNAVGVLVDLRKPNQYSKGTEQMRSILSTLNATPAAPTAANANK
ncbi:hypothetical protein ABL78_6703 [Leptomonas seymouri]|uniref:Clathrin light chain n=1 Tax=Leptomonas seymouri TaxID=5684 RepID=A0A0N0P401_LEPSE|nr:hypothetical protein ABL78_6703 [Leptomonas seymouri]|eukprot:KPI84247.1 hypothetical protein ABL78_6703 [Leptomonas seymouri]